MDFFSQKKQAVLEVGAVDNSIVDDPVTSSQLLDVENTLTPSVPN